MVLYDESVHEVKGHLALLVEVKRVRMPFTPSSSYGVGDETRQLSFCYGSSFTTKANTTLIFLQDPVGTTRRINRCLLLE